MDSTCASRRAAGTFTHKAAHIRTRRRFGQPTHAILRPLIEQACSIQLSAFTIAMLSVFFRPAILHFNGDNIGNSYLMLGFQTHTAWGSITVGSISWKWKSSVCLSVCLSVHFNFRPWKTHSLTSASWEILKVLPPLTARFPSPLLASTLDHTRSATAHRDAIRSGFLAQGTLIMYQKDGGVCWFQRTPGPEASLVLRGQETLGSNLTHEIIYPDHSWLSLVAPGKYSIK